MADLNEQPSLEIQGIQTLLQEAHDTVEAIRAGAVDGFVITGADGGDEVFILEGANQPYRLFVEQMNDGAVTLSNDAIVLYANKYFADLMKTPLEQIIGAPFEDFLTDKDLFQRVIKKTEPGNLEAELLASNGTRLPVYISYSPLRNGNNSWICLVIMDASEQKQQQTLLQESQRLAAIGKTAAVLSHEIANPLSGMLMTVQVMQRQIVEPAAGDLFRDDLRLLQEEIRRLAALLSDFRSLSHLVQLNLAPTDVASLVTETIKPLHAEATHAGIQIAQKFSADVPLLTVDKQRMKQVFLNLCKNAMEAMPSGGTLTINGVRESDNIVIEIIDTGPGIPEGVDVFDFFTTTKPEGSGLGLAVVRQIVTAHGGIITYLSKPGEGTSFRLTFPLRDSRLLK
jgi:PAS domain S-box-containing protein